MVIMNKKNVINEVEEYVKLKLEIGQLTEQMDRIAIDLKKLMNEKHIDNMRAGSHVVTYKEVRTRRLDTSGLKDLFGEEALEPLMKTVTTHRFSVT